MTNCRTSAIAGRATTSRTVSTSGSPPVGHTFFSWNWLRLTARSSIMKAIVVRPGQRDSIHMRDMPDPKMKPDQVAVKMLRVGLCATDAEINHGLYGQPPDGD